MSTIKSVLITGCTEGGIGAALAHSFADRDYRVFATARHVPKMTSLANRPNVVLLELDVTNESQISRAVQTISDETGGRLDYLINNAGQLQFMPLLDVSVEDAKAVFDANVWGPLYMSKAFSPLLIAAKGSIVNITSISGHLYVPWMGVYAPYALTEEEALCLIYGIYAASKRSLEVMAETLRLELQPFGVRVTSVVTGTVATNVFNHFNDIKLPDDSLYQSIASTIYSRAQGSGSPKNRLTPAEYAEKVVSAVLKQSQSGVLWGPGFMASFVKFATAWLPFWLQDKMWTKGSGVDQMMSRS